MLAEAFDAVVRVTVDACRAVYAERLQGVVLFGSAARRRMRPDSDIDLLVVAEPLPDGRLPRMDEFDAVEDRVAAALARSRQVGVATRLSPIVRTPRRAGPGRVPDLRHRLRWRGPLRSGRIGGRLPGERAGPLGTSRRPSPDRFR